MIRCRSQSTGEVILCK